MPRFATASLIAIAVTASPALAQPGSSPATAVPVPAPPAPSPPPPTTSPPPVTVAPPPVTTTPPESTTPPETAPVNTPVQQAAPPPVAPIELSANVAYPNGLADPEFANMTTADNDRGGGGFPWGLLGLLGLLGLIPWLRGGPKTIYVERERPRTPDPTRPGES